MDNRDRYPESVATVGTVRYGWNWSNPTKLTGSRKRGTTIHRAISEYLRAYLPAAKVMYCPNGPGKYKYLQAAWDAGNDWDNPDTPVPSDPARGNYCFYWNYIGYLPDRSTPFFGPKTAVGSPRTSRLVMTDYFGYGQWQSRCGYGSCERFKRSRIVPQTWRVSPYWSRTPDLK